MNIRKVYLGLIAVLSVALFYEWTSDSKSASISKHLALANIEMAKPKFLMMVHMFILKMTY